ncbi:hypothetical protein CCZ01_06300 [Helicobacter monodelphidis]|uniref:hypothetical protein n=1 Tax=Helicobacter sp. 15-1451 TaxID=2004995 RepID=UPI000DCD06F4|nr:hypothetical protein [Helicobacter sp. 15-1451]RAX57307.1 hypothetical protein CCZ01_06300 [Helicobacter sp. 15-1451]
MQFAFIDTAPALSDIASMYRIGFLSDMRVVCVMVAVILLCAYFTPPLRFVLNRYLCNFSLGLKWAKLLFFAYIVLVSFIVIFSAIGNFYYFQTYHTKIDIFIFGLKDDDTMYLVMSKIKVVFWF